MPRDATDAVDTGGARRALTLHGTAWSARDAPECAVGPDSQRYSRAPLWSAPRGRKGAARAAVPSQAARRRARCSRGCWQKRNALGRHASAQEEVTMRKGVSRRSLDAVAALALACEAAHAATAGHVRRRWGATHHCTCLCALRPDHPDPTSPCRSGRKRADDGHHARVRAVTRLPTGTATPRGSSARRGGIDAASAARRTVVPPEVTGAHRRTAR